MNRSNRTRLHAGFRAGLLALAACVAAGSALAQGVDKNVPARQKASTKPPTAVTQVPVLVTPISHHPKTDPRKIIFVGGAQGKSQLNPQPIPPGEPNPPLTR